MSSRRVDPTALLETAVSPSRWSLSARLGVLFAALSLTVLISAGSVLYLVFARGIYEDEVRSSSEQIDAIRKVLQTDPQLLGPDGERIRWQYATVENSDYLLRILDDRQQIVFETPGLEDLLPGELFPPPQRKPSMRALDARIRTRKGRTYVVAATEIDTGLPSDPRRVVQLAYDGTPEALLLTKYRNEALVAMGLAALTLVFLASLLARRGLRPLRQITLATQRVTAQHLDERIGQRPWPKELSALATAFDEMLARLERSVSQLSQFSADLAHELRTPLNNLIGEAEVALSRKRSAEEYREALESNLEECGRLARVVQELLFLARAGGDASRIELQRIELREVVENVRSVYEAVAEERGVTIECRGSAAVEASPTLLRRALINLVSNAVKYSAPGGRVEIAIEGAAGATRVSVSDNGYGIPAEHVPRIFDRFYRVDSARTRDPGGTGLGLAIVKSIVDLHGGRIEVESRLQQGTRVTLELASPAGG